MFDLRKAGIPVPFAPKGTEVERWLEMASVYCSHVGSGTSPNETWFELSKRVTVAII